MSEARHPRAWAFFALVTLLAAVPLAVGFYWLRGGLRADAMRQHQRQINNQLNQWQEQFYDAKWDSLADTSDDVLHLGSYDEAQLMADTLVWYVYPDGHTFIEGTAVVGLDGRLRASKLAAVIDDEGEPLKPAQLAKLKKTRPWLESPWLDSYAFVIKAFQADPERQFYLSPLMQAPGRLVYVMASAWRDDQGRLKGAVIQQQAIAQFAQDIIAPGAKGLSLWIMDSRGTVGMASDPLARASAQSFAASGGLTRALAEGKAAARDGSFGASGGSTQNLPQGPAQLNWRTMEGSFVLAVVETQAALGAVGRHTLNQFGTIALLSLVLLAGAGAVYTLSSLRRESRMVEKDTLRRYAGTVSHRVRNALVVLSGVVEMLSEKMPLDTRGRQRVDSYSQAVEDIESTVKELEDLSKGEADLAYDGQLGETSMYRLDPKGDKGGQV